MENTQRQASIVRETRETSIKLTFNADGTGKSAISTGIGFLDHMLELFAKHGFFDLEIEEKGDLHVDCHHTMEDLGLVLGAAIAQALGDKAGIRGDFIRHAAAGVSQLGSDIGAACGKLAAAAVGAEDAAPMPQRSIAVGAGEACVKAYFI